MTQHTDGLPRAEAGPVGEAVEDTLGAGLPENAEAGMPQLNLETFPNQIFWLVVTLVVLYLIITRSAIPQIRGALEDRDQVVAGDLETAAELRQQAEQAEADYEKALADARAEAQKIAAQTRAEIQAEVDAAMAKADAEIAARQSESETRIREIRDAAARDVEIVAKDVAKAVVAALMPEAQDDQAVDSAVENRTKGAV